ncbi:MAG: hypothetical protein KUG82_15880 [Pseudomonadales bacterium]|nr:hypothetical protein [Pseudomonadales bacterium]
MAAASSGDLLGSIGLARQSLMLIGRPIPDTEEEIQHEIQDLLGSFYGNGRDIFKEIIAAKEIERREDVLALHLASEILTCTYATGQMTLLTLMACRTIDIAVKKGVDDNTCFGLALMALYYSMAEDYPRMSAYEDAMFAMVERYPDSFGAVRGLAASLFLTLHSKHSVDYLLDICQKVQHTCIKCGEISYVGNMGFVALWFEITKCNDLSDIREQTDKLLQYGKQYNLALTTSATAAIEISLDPLW